MLFAEAGITKLDLAEYFLAVSERMLPYCGGRPLSLVRCPEGPAKQCFFQKHTKKGMPAALKSVPVEEGDGEIADYLMVDSAAGLVAVAQIGGIEIHLWGSRAKTLEKPDRLVFDLDPDPSVDFAGVREAARDVRKLLQTAGLETFPLVTGGKGIHVVAPLDASQDWEIDQELRQGRRHQARRERARSLRRHHVEGQAQGPHLHRLAAQRARLDGHRALFAARQGRRRASPCPCRGRSCRASRAPTRFTIPLVLQRIKRKTDPWSGYFETRQQISKEALRFFA